MTGVVDTGTVIGLISGVISIIEATKTVYDTASNKKCQLKSFRQVAAQPPPVNEILHGAKEVTETPDESTLEALKPILKSCKEKVKCLEECFQEVVRKDSKQNEQNLLELCGSSAVIQKRHNKIRDMDRLMKGILEDIHVLVYKVLIGTATNTQMKEIEEPIKQLRRSFHLLDETGDAGDCYKPSLEMLRTLKGHKESVTSVAFSTDGTRLASASEDRTVRVWDTTNWNLLKMLEGHTDSVTSIAFSADGARLASASCDKTVRVWDVTEGMLLKTLEGHTDSVTSVAFSTDGIQLASASARWDVTVRVWDATEGMLLKILEGHTNSVTSVAFSSDGTRLASASYDKTVRVWDTTKWKLLKTLEGHTDSVTSVAFSADGTRLASASWDETVRVWDTTEWKLLKTLEGHTDSVTSVAFSTDGTRLASASARWDVTVRLWDAMEGMLLMTLEGHTDSVTSVAFSTDGTQLASASWDRTVRLWDAMARKQLQALEDQEPVLEKEDQDMFKDRSGLAPLLSDNSKVTKVDKTNQQTLELRKEMPGNGHPKEMGDDEVEYWNAQAKSRVNTILGGSSYYQDRNGPSLPEVIRDYVWPFYSDWLHFPLGPCNRTAEFDRNDDGHITSVTIYIICTHMPHLTLQGIIDKYTQYLVPEPFKGKVLVLFGEGTSTPSTGRVRVDEQNCKPADLKMGKGVL